MLNLHLVNLRYLGPTSWPAPSEGWVKHHDTPVHRGPRAKVSESKAIRVLICSAREHTMLLFPRKSGLCGPASPFRVTATSSPSLLYLQAIYILSFFPFCLLSTGCGPQECAEHKSQCIAALIFIVRLHTHPAPRDQHGAGWSSPAWVRNTLLPRPHPHRLRLHRFPCSCGNTPQLLRRRLSTYHSFCLACFPRPSVPYSNSPQKLCSALFLSDLLSFHATLWGRDHMGLSL